MEGFKLRAISSRHQYEDPSLSASYRIFKFAQYLSPQGALSYNTQGILHQLSLCQSAANGILRSVDTGRPVDGGNRVIDKITQRDELLLLSNSLDKIHTIVSGHLATEKVDLYWPNPLSLTDSTAQLGVVAGQMRGRIIILQERIAEEKAVIAANLNPMADLISSDCLGVIAEYLIT